MMIHSTMHNTERYYKCYICSKLLSTQYDYSSDYDYSCPICGLNTCDADTQACQGGDECDAITCLVCVEFHLQESHPAVETMANENG